MQRLSGNVSFFTCVVTLRRLRLNHHARVTALIVLRLVRHRPYYVTGVQPYRRSQGRQRRYQHTDNDLQNL